MAAIIYLSMKIKKWIILLAIAGISLFTDATKKPNIH